MPGRSHELRPALSSDAEAIAGVWLRSRKSSIPSLPAPVHSDEEVRQWVMEALIPNGTTWVVDTEVGVLAMMTLEDNWIAQLYVDPDHIRQGTGTLLLNHAKRLCPNGLDLWTFQSNARARRFYETHAFFPVGETSSDNEEAAPAVHYRWDGTANGSGGSR